jgi:cell division protein FtsQ
MTSTPVRIDPRIRERLIAVKREAGRRRLRLLLAGCCVLSTAGLAWLTINAPFFDIDRVEIRGDQRVSDKQIRAAARVDAHTPLLLVDAGAIAERIEALPWVANASVHREWPGTLRIDVSEHQASSYIRSGNKALLVAPTGRIVAEVDAAPEGVMEVRGVRRAPVVGQLLAPADAANIVGKLPLALAERVEAVDVSRGITLVLRGGGAIRLATADNLEAKAASAQAVLDHLDGEPFTYIDVSTPQRPVSR